MSLFVLVGGQCVCLSEGGCDPPCTRGWILRPRSLAVHKVQTALCFFSLSLSFSQARVWSVRLLTDWMSNLKSPMSHFFVSFFSSHLLAMCYRLTVHVAMARIMEIEKIKNKNTLLFSSDTQIIMLHCQSWQ